MKITVLLTPQILAAQIIGSSRRKAFERHMNGDTDNYRVLNEEGVEMIDLMLARALLMEEEIDKYRNLKQKTFDNIKPRLKEQGKLAIRLEDLYNKFYLRYFLKHSDSL